jgi:hypothetical protein
MAFEVMESRADVTRQFSWGAIFAGVVVVLITQVMLSLLGVSLGAGSIEPLFEKNPVAGLGIGTAIWLGLSVLISLFAGGWVSSRISGVSTRTKSTLHGVITWGLSSLIMIYVLSSALSGAFSGVAGVLGQTVSLAGRGVMVIAPELLTAEGDQIDADLIWTNMKGEAATILRDTKKPALQPKSIRKMVDKTANEAWSVVPNTPVRSQDTIDELTDFWGAIENRGEKVIMASDQEAIANVLAANTDMTKQEALATVASWQQTLKGTSKRISALRTKAGKELRNVADMTAEAVAITAAWSFAALFLGLSAAAAGGYVGCPTRGSSHIIHRLRASEIDKKAV